MGVFRRKVCCKGYDCALGQKRSFKTEYIVFHEVFVYFCSVLLKLHSLFVYSK